MEWWDTDCHQLYKIHGHFDIGNLDNIPIFEPIFQYSSLPTALNDMLITPLWCETKAGSSGPGFFPE